MREADQRCYMCNCSGRERGVVPCVWTCILHRTIRIYILFCIWDSVQLNHPYDTFSKFPEQAKER